jgi:phosphatidylserine/phosphatidylglycerophosphate/cardiolipin synthase-like enzyme
MNEETKSYFTGIEKKLIEMICDSNKSIKIAMAWFTSNDLKNCILDKKRQSSKIEIEIVVDDNEINENYFLDYTPKFDDLGIIIKPKVSSKFLHNKFMLIDDKTVITGSYNFSKKAKSNLENIVVIQSESLCSYYLRIFKFISTFDYLDENIQLLLDYPDFAQRIISTYYEFTKSEFIKYRNKILIGDCFTHKMAIGMN